MNRLRYFLLPLLVVLLAPLTMATEKGESPAVRQILDAKSKGEAYDPALWHQAKAEYQQRRAEAEASRRVSANKDGGSDSSSATVITAQNYQDNGTTVGKGNDALIASCIGSGGDTAEDAWYEVTLATPGTISAWTTCENVGPPSYDTRLAILDDQLNIIACNDDDPACGAPYYQSRITDAAVGAGTHYIVVDGWNGSEGDYELNVQWSEDGPPCGGSDSSNATVISTIPYSHTHDSTNDCDDILVTCELGGGTSGPDHWYSLSLDVDAFVDVTTTCDTTAIDTRISILASNGSTEIVCNDDDPTCPNGQSMIDDQLLSAGDYFVVVDSADLLGGNYTVEVDTTHAPPGLVFDLLPDIIVRENDLFDNDIVTSIEPGRTHLRLSNATPNIGDGKLHVYGVLPDNGDGTQDVMQRVFRDDGTFWDRQAGQFIFHEQHNHIHFEDWSEYRLRFITPGDGVGGIVAKGQKTSFCIIDLTVHDSSLPGYVPGGEFNSCGSTVQGLSVGWADIYSKGLTGQNIDITDVADGEYWLEAEVDPNNTLLEKDETNNAARIKVTIGTPTAVSPDSFEPNDASVELDSRPVGGPNSPNLGPVGPLTTVSSLTVHTNGNDDYFRFYMPATGALTDLVQINFLHADGNLELELLDDTGARVGIATGTGDVETVSLTGLPEGWYDARVFGFGGAVNTDYSITFDPSANGAPTVSVIDPPLGDVSLAHGIDTYTTTWSSNDPEGNETWVNIWANTTQTLDGNEIFLPTSQNLDATLGSYVVNTSYLDFDTYYIYVEVTDGGTTTGAWSDGTITLYNATDAPVDLTDLHTSKLLTNYPNPFNPSTTLRLNLQREADVDWRVFDARGQQVRVIHTGTLGVGLHERVWDGRDALGRPVSSGVYYNVVKSSEVDDRQKIVLLK